VFGKMWFKKVLKMTQKWSFWGHLEGPFGPLFQKFPRFRWCLVKWGSKRALKNGHLGSFGVIWGIWASSLLRMGSTDSESRGLSTKLDETDIHY
jgi:hypothetical protein